MHRWPLVFVLLMALAGCSGGPGPEPEPPAAAPSSAPPRGPVAATPGSPAAAEPGSGVRPAGDPATAEPAPAALATPATPAIPASPVATESEAGAPNPPPEGTVTAPTSPAAAYGTVAPTLLPGLAEYEAALSFLNQKDWERAIPLLTAAVERNPQLAEAWNDLSYAFLRQYSYNHPSPPGNPGAYGRAVAAAERAVALRPGWAQAEYNLGLALLAAGRYADALPHLRAVAEQRPERPEVLTALGLGLLGAGRPDEAISLCRQADELAGEFVLAARCLEEAGAGFTRLPESEAAVGEYRYAPDRGFYWAGPPREMETEFIRISPPWTCALAAADGFSSSFLDCYGEPPYFYRWSFSQPSLGTTPAGIGVGSPWEKVPATYGPTYQRAQTLFYAVADLHLLVVGSPGEGVTRILFRRPTPIFLIDDLMHDRTGPAPLGYGDTYLAGVAMGATEAQVEAVLGTGQEILRNEYLYVRLYQGGRVKVTFQRTGRASDTEVLGGSGSTPRGVALGDTAAQVRKVYGKPAYEREELIGYTGESGAPWPFFLHFYLEEGKVVRVRLGPQR